MGAPAIHSDYGTPLGVDTKVSRLEMKVQIKRVRSVLIPGYATSGSAAVDLVCASDEPIILAPGEVVMIPTGIAVNIGSSAVCAKVWPRSGLSTKQGLVLANTVGVIDSDYQGEIFIAARNQNHPTGDLAKDAEKTISIEPGMRIAQMTFELVIRAELEEVAEFSEATERGAGGFGSTGT